MKTRIAYSILGLLLATGLFAQDRTTVTASSYDVSDNLDLKAVASIFGESRDLEDFERRLNDPRLQISNLDLNGDNQVDYLRVIESTQDYTHLVIVQAVLDRDVYQDVATIEVEKSGNDVQVQVVGDVYMYGPNYIYEPVYVTRPVFFATWWGIGYHPYVSSWYWGYYPSYWHVWAPMPIYRYRNHVHVHINVHNHYNYVNVRRSRTAVALHNTRRADGYARRYPDRSFAQRNANATNRHDLVNTRRTASVRTADRSRVSSGTRSQDGVRQATRSANTTSVRGNSATRDYPTRSNPNAGNRTGTRSTGQSTRSEAATRPNNPGRGEATRSVQRSSAPSRSSAPAATRSASPQRAQVQRQAPNVRQSQARQAAPQARSQQQAPRMERSSAPSHGNSQSRGGSQSHGRR